MIIYFFLTRLQVKVIFFVYLIPKHISIISTVKSTFKYYLRRFKSIHYVCIPINF